MNYVRNLLQQQLDHLLQLIKTELARVESESKKAKSAGTIDELMRDIAVVNTARQLDFRQQWVAIDIKRLKVIEDKYL